MSGDKYNVWSWDEASDGWTGPSLLTITDVDKSDPEAVKDALNLEWEKTIGGNTPADLNPAKRIGDLSKLDMILPDPPGAPPDASGPGYWADGKYGRLDTIFVWKEIR
jgi:hypothetical protein